MSIQEVKGLAAEKYINPEAGIIGVGIANPIAKIRIYVDSMQKMSSLPDTLGGYKVVPTYAGHVRALQTCLTASELQSRQRPAPGGCQVGNDLMLGTMGAKVIDNASGEAMILSNSHVISDMGNKPRGSPVRQPDNSQGEEPIAYLKDSTVLNPVLIHEIDAAVAAAVNDTDLGNEISCVGQVLGARHAQMGAPVSCTSMHGFMQGVVTDVSATFMVAFEGGNIEFRRQIVISPPVGRPGSSGSVIVSNGYVIGLLFAGSEVLTLANHIEPVMKRFNFKFAGTSGDDFTDSPNGFTEWWSRRSKFEKIAIGSLVTAAPIGAVIAAGGGGKKKKR
jgi:hypothetical protein